MIYYPFQWNRYIIRRCPQKCLKSGYTETGSRQVKWSNWRIESVDVRKKSYDASVLLWVPEGFLSLKRDLWAARVPLSIYFLKA